MFLGQLPRIFQFQKVFSFGQAVIELPVPVQSAGVICLNSRIRLLEELNFQARLLYCYRQSGVFPNLRIDHGSIGT